MENDLTYYVVLASFIMPLVLAGILIWFILNYQKKKNQYEIETRERKLREQELLIEKQEALQNERNRIAGEMHDDLGGGLTTINFLSEKLMKNLGTSEEVKQVHKIASTSKNLVSSMSEIIWAMNSGFDDLDSLVSYIRRYAVEFLSDFDIKFEINLKGEFLEKSISGEKRRNIFLVIKEALNNTAKHAKASKVTLEVLSKESFVEINYNDDGTVSENTNDLGNGIRSMRTRVKDIGGQIDIQKEQSYLINIKVPI